MELVLGTSRSSNTFAFHLIANNLMADSEAVCGVSGTAHSQSNQLKLNRYSRTALFFLLHFQI